MELDRNTKSKLSRTFNTLAALALLSASATSQAKPHPALEECSTPASELRADGKPLTYETAARARGAIKMASTGVVYAPVTLPNGRTAIYAVYPTGCARKTGLEKGLR